MCIFNPFCHTVTLRIQNIKKNKKKHWSKVPDKTIWNFPPQKCTHLVKQVIFYRKVFKLPHSNSPTLHVSPKTPIFEGPKKTTSTIMQIAPPKQFPKWSVHNPIEPVCLKKYFMKIQLQLIFPKKCGVWSRKGSNIWTLL